ncbi:MAG: hypothetical protein P8Y53_04790, partial [Pseudolabrys sp.]
SAPTWPPPATRPSTPGCSVLSLDAAFASECRNRGTNVLPRAALTLKRGGAIAEDSPMKGLLVITAALGLAAATPAMAANNAMNAGTAGQNAATSGSASTGSSASIGSQSPANGIASGNRLKTESRNYNYTQAFRSAVKRASQPYDIKNFHGVGRQ